EVTYSQADVKPSDTVKEFRTVSSGVQNDYGSMNSYYGVGFNWVPFYAKMSFLGSKILYFDMVVTPALGMMNYDQQIEYGSIGKSAFAYGIDFTQYFFFTKNLSLRLDIRNRWFNEDVAKYRDQSYGGTIAKGTTVKTKQTQNSQFLLGINYFF
ncbi:MAG: outer membrane beta-barrel domain-containing protein, partial [Bdellovibrionales bacterium]|nr:outer membrane beta-barrel domain-containing protein [Bdellovibrionales bacterium]